MRSTLGLRRPTESSAGGPQSGPPGQYRSSASRFRLPLHLAIRRPAISPDSLPLGELPLRFRCESAVSHPAGRSRSAGPTRHRRSGRAPLDDDAVSADSRARRAARVTPEEVEQTLQTASRVRRRSRRPRNRTELESSTRKGVTMRSKRRNSRVSRTARPSTNASLRITCKDGRGVPIAIAGRVRVIREADGGASWTARGRKGEVSEFQFDIPPGHYVIDVEAAGFKRRRDAATVVGGEPTLKDVFLQIADEAEEDEGAGSPSARRHALLDHPSGGSQATVPMSAGTEISKSSRSRDAPVSLCRRPPGM